LEVGVGSGRGNGGERRRRRGKPEVLHRRVVRHHCVAPRLQHASLLFELSNAPCGARQLLRGKTHVHRQWPLERR